MCVYNSLQQRYLPEEICGTLELGNSCHAELALEDSAVNDFLHLNMICLANGVYLHQNGNIYPQTESQLTTGCWAFICMLQENRICGCNKNK